MTSARAAWDSLGGRPPAPRRRALGSLGSTWAFANPAFAAKESGCSEGERRSVKRVIQAAKASPGCHERLHVPHDLGQAAAQAAQLQDDQGVAPTQAAQQRLQLGVRAIAHGVLPLLHDVIAPRFSQRP